MAAYLSQDNLFYLLDIAEKYDCKSLEASCGEYLGMSFEDIWMDDPARLLQVQPNTWAAMLRSDELAVRYLYPRCVTSLHTHCALVLCMRSLTTTYSLPTPSLDLVLNEYAMKQSLNMLKNHTLTRELQYLSSYCHSSGSAFCRKTLSLMWWNRIALFLVSPWCNRSCLNITSTNRFQPLNPNHSILHQEKVGPCHLCPFHIIHYNTDISTLQQPTIYYSPRQCILVFHLCKRYTSPPPFLPLLSLFNILYTPNMVLKLSGPHIIIEDEGRLMHPTNASCGWEGARCQVKSIPTWKSICVVHHYNWSQAPLDARFPHCEFTLISGGLFIIGIVQQGAAFNTSGCHPGVDTQGYELSYLGLFVFHTPIYMSLSLGTGLGFTIPMATSTRTVQLLPYLGRMLSPIRLVLDFTLRRRNWDFTRTVHPSEHHTNCLQQRIIVLQ